MKKLWLGIIGLAAATTANAAVVTFTLSLDDDGTGVHSVPGSFAVYATTSSDNGGLFAYGVDLQGQIDFIANMGVQARYNKVGQQAKFAGFSAGVSEDSAAGKISGLPDLAKGINLIPVYGYGQEAGNMSAVPPKPDSTWSYTDTNPNSAGPIYGAKMLLGIGGYSGAKPSWQTGSVDNKASVYDDRSGTESIIAVLNLVVDPPPPGGNVFRIVGSSTHPNLATGNQITVTGSNGLYVSEVDQLTADANTGGAPVVSIGDEAGSLFVMAKISGTAADVAAILADAALNNASGDPEAARLHALYDSQFGAGGFNLLLKTPNFAGAKVVDWDFTAGNPGAVVDQLAVVPEPATMGLMAVAGVGLLARRRRKA
jgi:hypothetical protein